MSHFITLTLWEAGPPAISSRHGTPVLLAPSKIKWMRQDTRAVCREPDHYKLPVAERPRELVTWIDFGGDEDSGLQVCESPETILTMIEGKKDPASPVLRFPYTNHRGETAERVVSAWHLAFLPNPGYGYPPGWFITGRDNARNAVRTFALDSIPLDRTKTFVLNLRTSS